MFLLSKIYKNSFNEIISRLNNLFKEQKGAKENENENENKLSLEIFDLNENNIINEIDKKIKSKISLLFLYDNIKSLINNIDPKTKNMFLISLYINIIILEGKINSKSAQKMAFLRKIKEKECNKDFPVYECILKKNIIKKESIYNYYIDNKILILSYKKNENYENDKGIFNKEINDSKIKNIQEELSLFFQKEKANKKDIITKRKNMILTLEKYLEDDITQFMRDASYKEKESKKFRQIIDKFEKNKQFYINQFQMHYNDYDDYDKKNY